MFETSNHLIGPKAYFLSFLEQKRGKSQYFVALKTTPSMFKGLLTTIKIEPIMVLNKKKDFFSITQKGVTGNSASCFGIYHAHFYVIVRFFQFGILTN